MNNNKPMYAKGDGRQPITTIREEALRKEKEEELSKRWKKDPKYALMRRYNQWNSIGDVRQKVWDGSGNQSWQWIFTGSARERQTSAEIFGERIKSRRRSERLGTWTREIEYPYRKHRKILLGRGICEVR